MCIANVMQVNDAMQVDVIQTIVMQTNAIQTNVIQVDAMQVKVIQTIEMQVSLIQVSSLLQSNTREWTMVQNLSVTCIYQSCKAPDLMRTRRALGVQGLKPSA